MVGVTRYTVRHLDERPVSGIATVDLETAGPVTGRECTVLELEVLVQLGDAWVDGDGGTFVEALGRQTGGGVLLRLVHILRGGSDYESGEGDEGFGEHDVGMNDSER